MISYGERATLSLNFQVEHERSTLTSFAIAPTAVRQYPAG